MQVLYAATEKYAPQNVKPKANAIVAIAYW